MKSKRKWSGSRYILLSMLLTVTLLLGACGSDEQSVDNTSETEKEQTIFGVTLNTEISTDVNGDGADDTLCIEAVEREEEFCTGYTIRCNDVVLETKHSGYFSAAYLLQTDKGSYLYIENTVENDLNIVHVYDLKGGNPVYVDSTESAFYNQYAQYADAFILNSRVNVLGTYSAYRSYYVGENGMPIPHQKHYRIDNRWGKGLISKVDLEVRVYADGQNPESYSVVTMPAGTVFEPYATDGDSYLEMVLEDGSHCVLEFQREGHLIQIQDMSEYDCFEELPYAG